MIPTKKTLSPKVDVRMEVFHPVISMNKVFRLYTKYVIVEIILSYEMNQTNNL